MTVKLSDVEGKDAAIGDNHGGILALKHPMEKLRRPLNLICEPLG
jgi:hypothetical protein